MRTVQVETVIRKLVRGPIIVETRVTTPCDQSAEECRAHGHTSTAGGDRSSGNQCGERLPVAALRLEGGGYIDHRSETAPTLEEARTLARSRRAQVRAQVRTWSREAAAWNGAIRAARAAKEVRS